MVADLIGSQAASFHLVETHAGAPIHELNLGGEWEKGVKVAREKAPAGFSYFPGIGNYLNVKRYPAGWVLASGRLAERIPCVHVRLFDSCERVANAYKQIGELDRLKMNLPRNITYNFQQANGYDLPLDIQMPALVFLDPPFSPKAELDWRKLAVSCRVLVQRGIPFMAWYPFYWPSNPQKLIDNTGCSAWEVQWAKCGPKHSQNLKGCGLLVSSDLAKLLQRMNVGLKALANQCLSGRLLIRRPTGRGID